jgi:NAD(P)H dehydrogenase (quinone)
VTAGVKYIVYTAIQVKNNSGWTIPGVTARDLEMETLLTNSGLHYTIVHNTLYTDTLPFLLGGGVIEKGLLFPSGDGRAALATRADLGEALARMISADKVFPEHITLSNSENWSRTDIAQTLSVVIGKNIAVIDASVDEYIAYQEASGLPHFYAKFASDWALATKAGEFEETDPFLENLLGRKPASLESFLKEAYAPQSDQ